ncbi:protein-disulfide reductase DsbD domain-containing protein [Bosea sp. NBC_00550]|uniref:protein-disulfide reductase DsbD domain-containing protein n=1 Tax=Bosea sp. NBC_00550 TaxID=2969621 RepID=UPI002232B786|nr:protein-disulfide reductase DsbD domain-containing protein [Bosea sp. NBC_00550]UZF92494.1 protein-disulfide reductase DsbD family protein [Bosea sp. NBC_00550]
MNRVFSLLAMAPFVLSAVAHAQEAATEAATSPWSTSEHSKLRLIAGPTTPTGKQRVGVEIVMSPGFKTYWRSPGEFGVPPSFDWSGSINIGGLDVRWPVPERFQDSAGYSVGYVGEVVIPISVQPVDPSRPVMVVLKLDYAVCEKICIPAKGEASLWLEPGVTTVTSPRLESFEARVPVPVKPGTHKEKTSIIEAKLDDTVVDPGLRLVLQPPPDGKVQDIFAEGPGMWSFGKSRLAPQPDGTVVAQIRINERPKSAAGPVPLIFTIRGMPKPVETRLELDIPASRP